MSSNTSGTSSMSTEPFVWVLIPLVVVFSVGTFVIFVWNKKRRERYPTSYAWPEDRVLVGSAYVRYRRGTRWSPWSETRSMEGLNELGEAPPPYDSKKPPGITDRHGRLSEASPSGADSRDIEAGLPPEYPSRPPQAHISSSRDNQ